MKTAVDSSVLLDVFAGDPRFGVASREALRKAYDAGMLVACDVVWAEVRAHFEGDDAFERAVELLGIGSKRSETRLPWQLVVCGGKVVLARAADAAVSSLTFSLLPMRRRRRMCC